MGAMCDGSNRDGPPNTLIDSLIPSSSKNVREEHSCGGACGYVELRVRPLWVVLVLFQGIRIPEITGGGDGEGEGGRG